MAGIPISYGALDMQTSAITTTETDVFSPAQKNIQIDNLAQRDGGVFVRDSLLPKTFAVAGTIRADTIQALDALLDQFYLALSISQSNFEIDNGAGRRRYICTPQPPVIARSRGLTTAGFSVAFTVPSGVGQDMTESTLLAPSAVTASSTSIAFTTGGTYRAEPKVRVAYSSIADGTGKTVTISNDATLRGIRITRNWQSGDVVDVDCQTMDIYVNSIPVPFTGVFPAWEPGSSAITVIDDFTSRTGLVSASYTRRWL